MINIKSNREDVIVRAKADVEERKNYKKNFLKNQNKKPDINKENKDKKEKIS